MPEPNEGATIEKHAVGFLRLLPFGPYYAVCDCGWRSQNPNLNDLQAEAAVHDLWHDDMSRH